MEHLRDYTRTISTLPKGTAFTRFAMALAVSKGSLPDAAEYSRQWRDTPQVELVLRAAVAAGTTTTSAWASELVTYDLLAAEFVELLRPATILGRIANVAMVPFMIKVARVTSGASSSWVQQGAPSPISALAFDTISLDPFKQQSTVILTNEVVRLSKPSATAICQRDLLASIAAYSDVQFIDPTVTASAGVRPASITNGATTRSSTGSAVAQITADVQAMFASALAGGVSLANAVWVLHPRTAAFLGSVLTTGNVRMWPETSIKGGQWFGLPVITSASVPIDTGADTYAILIDGAEIMVADGGVELDVSANASLVMDSAPSNPATSTVSLFQSDMVALRATRYLNYTRRRDAAVQVLSDVSY